MSKSRYFNAKRVDVGELWRHSSRDELFHVLHAVVSALPETWAILAHAQTSGKGQIEPSEVAPYVVSYADVPLGDDHLLLLGLTIVASEELQNLVLKGKWYSSFAIIFYSKSDLKFAGFLEYFEGYIASEGVVCEAVLRGLNDQNISSLGSQKAKQLTFEDIGLSEVFRMSLRSDDFGEYMDLNYHTLGIPGETIVSSAPRFCDSQASIWFEMLGAKSLLDCESRFMRYGRWNPFEWHIVFLMFDDQWSLTGAVELGGKTLIYWK